MIYGALLSYHHSVLDHYQLTTFKINAIDASLNGWNTLKRIRIVKNNIICVSSAYIILPSSWFWKISSKDAVYIVKDGDRWQILGTPSRGLYGLERTLFTLFILPQLSTNEEKLVLPHFLDKSHFIYVKVEHVH